MSSTKGESGRPLHSRKPDYDALADEPIFQGSAVAYCIDAKRKGIFDPSPYSCDFEVDFNLLTHPKQLRDPNRKRAKPVRYSRARRSLEDELIVLFGPNVSARQAVDELRRLVRRIRNKGLLVRVNGGWECERVGRGGQRRR